MIQGYFHPRLWDLLPWHLQNTYTHVTVAVSSQDLVQELETLYVLRASLGKAPWKWRNGTIVFLKSLTRLPQGATGVPPVRLKILLRPWRPVLNGARWAALDTVHLQFECTPYAESLIKKKK